MGDDASGMFPLTLSLCKLTIPLQVDSLTQQVTDITAVTTKQLRLILLQFIILMCLVLYYGVFNTSSSSIVEPSLSPPDLSGHCETVRE